MRALEGCACTTMYVTPMRFRLIEPASARARARYLGQLTPRSRRFIRARDLPLYGLHIIFVSRALREIAISPFKKASRVNAVVCVSACCALASIRCVAGLECGMVVYTGAAGIVVRDGDRIGIVEFDVYRESGRLKVISSILKLLFELIILFGTISTRRIYLSLFVHSIELYQLIPDWSYGLLG